MLKERLTNVKAELTMIARDLEPFADDVLAENPDDSEVTVCLNRTRALGRAVRQICNIFIRVINALP